jgi:hypothetical protein
MGTQQDRDVLRTLAAEVAALAAQPIQQERIRLWTRLNDLRPERPMLWITEIPWGEFEDGVEELRPVCADANARELERALRRKLFTARRLPCDEVVAGTWDVPMAISGADYGVATSEQQIRQGASYIQSHHYEPVIRDVDDIATIRMPQVRHDAGETARRVESLEALFGDILPIRVVGPRQHFFTAWDDLVRWTGVTEALVDLSERPEYIHAIMRRMTDSFLSRMTQTESLGLLSPSNDLVRVGSGAAGYTGELPQPDAARDRVRLIDQWGGATPQIFADVSPAMHEEFALRYEIEVMSRCGLNYYGCCEPVHNKMDLLATVPRLRKISISPWCDVEKAAQRAARPYVFSHKPSPAILAEDRFDAVRAERDICDRLARSGAMPCEFIMKDISTVRGDVHRLVEWCRIAHRVLLRAPERA